LANISFAGADIFTLAIFGALKVVPCHENSFVNTRRNAGGINLEKVKKNVSSSATRPSAPLLPLYDFWIRRGFRKSRKPADRRQPKAEM